MSENMFETLNYITHHSAYTPTQVKSVLNLFNNGCSIPFIARYRKEQTGNLDEVAIEKIKVLHEKAVLINNKKQKAIQLLQENKLLTDDLKNRIASLYDEFEIDDILLPFKKSRKTLADIAIEKGFDVFAFYLLKNISGNFKYKLNELSKKLSVKEEEILEGSKYIIAKWINENLLVRSKLREAMLNKGYIVSNYMRGKEKDAINYKDYFNYRINVSRIQPHRFLAIIKGVEENLLNVKIEIAEPDVRKIILEEYFKLKFSINEKYPSWIIDVTSDAYKRLLHPSIENECLQIVKEKADDTSIEIFAGNLYQLLMQLPVKQQPIMAFDPGFKSGCKMVILDSNGNLKNNKTLFPFSQPSESIRVITTQLEIYKIRLIAIGNGKGGRELKEFLEKYKLKDINIKMVNESGASVYSASQVAREEFPEYDITVRGAVSIGRRTLDPLSELVKIEPKAIGVGQYQHVVNQKKLQQKLHQVIENCVNKVGVNINTSSKYLLSYVSGISENVAEKIIEYRNEKNGIQSREELKKIKGMGESKYILSAGFIRIPAAKNFLDNTRIHPEKYYIVEKIMKELKVKGQEILGNNLLQNLIPEHLTDEQTGIETINDILQELMFPFAEQRMAVQKVNFNKGIRSYDQLTIGYETEGIITNITAFGCFVDIGIGVNGLLHTSKISLIEKNISIENLNINDVIFVKVSSIDFERKRFQLEMISMKNRN